MLIGPNADSRCPKQIESVAQGVALNCQFQLSRRANDAL